MLAVKAVQIRYQPSEDVLRLLETFRRMVNYCIHVGLEKGVSSRFRLSNEVYHKLTGYGYHSWYVLGAIEVATVILRNYRRAKRRNRKTKVPRARRLMAKIGNQAYKIVGDQLRIPIKPREYFYVKLHKRVLEFMSDATLRLGSVTLTASKVVLTFVKTAEVAEPRGYVAFDINEKSVDGITSDGKTIRYGLTRIYEINSNLFERVRKFQRKTANDNRIQKKVLCKWYRKRSNRVEAILHKVSKEIVENAKADGYGIILENLKGIKKVVNRKTWRINRFNGKAQRVSVNSKRLKRRLNQACMRKLQHFIKYKALWEGVKVIEVNPKGTSSRCSICGSSLEYLNVHYARCPKCGILDRQWNAAINLLKTQDELLRFGRDRWADVAVKRNEGSVNSNPLSKSPEVNYKHHE